MEPADPVNGPVPFASRFRSAAESPGFLLWKTANRHQRLQREALATLGISPTHFSLLACFADLTRRKGRPVSQAEVAEHAGLDKMVVSDGTRALLARQLIERRRSDSDRRAFGIALSPHGVATCNKALALVEACDATFFERCSDGAALIAMLRDLLNEVSPAPQRPTISTSP